MIVDELGRIPMSPFLVATLTRAANYAEAQAHVEVTLEHVLLALTEDPEASVVLKSSSVDVGRLSADVSGYLGRIEERRTPNAPSSVLISRDLKRILEAAAAAAQQGRRKEINGAIVLAAIVGDGDSTAAHMLRAQGLTFEEAIRALQKATVQPPQRPVHDPVAAPTPAPSPTAPAAERSQPAQTPTGSTEEVLASVRERIQTRTVPPTNTPMPSPAQSPAPAPAQTAAPALAREPLPAPAAPDRAPVLADLQRQGGGIAPHWQPVQQPVQVRPSQPSPAGAPAVPSGGPNGADGWAPPYVPQPVAAAPLPRARAPAPPVPIPAPPRQAQPGPPPGQPMPLGLPPHPSAAPRAPWPQQQPGGDPRAAPPRQRQPGQSGNVRVATGQLVENVPRRMRVGLPVVVEARVARAEVKAIAEGLQGGGAVFRHEVMVTKAMSVRLRAPEGGFYIETSSPETQWIENVLGLMADDFASWRWTVTPRTRGKKRLQLVISARTVGADGLAAETALPDQVIEVKVGINYSKTALRWSGWVAAAVAGGVLARFGEGVFEPVMAVVSGLVGG